MPALIGYMVAIVVTLGGYFAGLQWLVSPPDPWQRDSKMAQSHATPAKKRVAAVKPAEPAEAEAPVASSETKTPETTVATETPTPVQPAALQADKHIQDAMARQSEPAAAAPTRTAEAAPPKKPSLRHEPHRIRPAVHKRVAAAKPPERRLEMMMLRTYERPDGTRFTRLLPMSTARNAMAFQLDGGW